MLSDWRSRAGEWLGRVFRTSHVPDYSPLCILPWIHAHVETTGDVGLCCVARGAGQRLGNVHGESLTQIFHSQNMSSIRNQMLAGAWPEECSACRDRELLGVESYRKSSNKAHPNHFQELSAEQGSYQPKIRSIDIRLNNVCNFKCRSCHGFASNRWFSEHNLIYPENQISAKYQGFDKLQSFWDDFDQHILKDLDEIHLAGGEPLITDAHYHLLEKLIAAGKTNVALQYDTNLSQLTFKHWDAVALWRKFPNLQISMSLDGTGAKGEYIREGLNYRDWLKNVDRIQRELPHAKRNLHFVVSIFNVVDFPAHYREILDAKCVDASRIALTFLEWPEFLNAQVLKPEIKFQVEVDLRNLLTSDIELPARMRKQIEALIVFLHEKDLYPVHGAAFSIKTKLLDQTRGQNASELFPALRPMLGDNHL